MRSDVTGFYLHCTHFPPSTVSSNFLQLALEAQDTNFSISFQEIVRCLRHNRWGKLGMNLKISSGHDLFSPKAHIFVPSQNDSFSFLCTQTRMLPPPRSHVVSTNLCTPCTVLLFPSPSNSREARVHPGPRLPAGRGLRPAQGDLPRPLSVTDLRQERRVQGQRSQANLHLQAGIRGRPVQGLRRT